MLQLPTFEIIASERDACFDSQTKIILIKGVTFTGFLKCWRIYDRTRTVSTIT